MMYKIIYVHIEIQSFFVVVFVVSVIQYDIEGVINFVLHRISRVHLVL